MTDSFSPIDLQRRGHADGHQNAKSRILSLVQDLHDGHPKMTLTKSFLGFEPAARVAVFSEDSKKINRLCATLKRLKFKPLLLSSLQTGRPGWHRTFDRFAELCIADIDAIQRFMDPIEFCRGLRRTHAHLPLIVVSETYLGRNLSVGPERFCDASAPLTANRDTMADVISAAQSNCLSRRISEEMNYTD